MLGMNRFRLGLGLVGIGSGQVGTQQGGGESESDGGRRPGEDDLLRLAQVDTQAQPTLAQRFTIRSIPTLVLFHQGREIARQAGAMDANGIVRWARHFVGA